MATSSDLNVSQSYLALDLNHTALFSIDSFPFSVSQ